MEQNRIERESRNFEENLSPSSYLTIKAYKDNIKRVLISSQGSGSESEWQPDNFPLYNIKGLRKSRTTYRKNNINYKE